jgi:hypothetical protein
MVHLNGSLQSKASRGLPPEIVTDQKVLAAGLAAVRRSTTLERLRHVDGTAYGNGYRIRVVLPDLKAKFVRDSRADRCPLR